MENSKKIRVWVDGCFDMVHFGHANALRQAKELGHELIVGVHSDEEISKHKGPTVFNEEERYKLVRSIKWVDEVVEAAPYVTELKTLEKYDCDFVAHGNDITMTADNQDTYALVKQAGKYREFQRTEGVSTTDLVGRMLLANKKHHKSAQCESSSPVNQPTVLSKWTKGNDYLPNTLRITQFQDGIREPYPDEKVVYVPGTFDMFHVGHITFLEKCREWGKYIIIGLYNDKVGNSIHSSNYPIMNVHERLLSVLSCKYVSNVIIGPDPIVSEELIKQFSVDYVIQGVVKDHTCSFQNHMFFDIPTKMGIFHQIESGSTMTNMRILNRLIANRIQYEQRNKEKISKEFSLQNYA